tara:strand:+ start:1170 stop:1553 length:384 start_codon:yes stop_codon:yes gene_type:complete
MSEKNIEIHPSRWRARTNNKKNITIRIYDQKNKIYDVHFPLDQLIKINKIFKEIIGYSEKEKFLETDWQNTVFELDKENINMNLQKDQQSSKYCFNFEDKKGSKIKYHLSLDDLKKLQKNITKEIKF